MEITLLSELRTRNFTSAESETDVPINYCNMKASVGESDTKGNSVATKNIQEMVFYERKTNIVIHIGRRVEMLLSSLLLTTMVS